MTGHVCFDGRKSQRTAPPIIHVTVVKVTLKLTIVVLSITVIVNFGGRVQGGIVNFNSRVRVAGFSGGTSCRSAPVTIDSALLRRLGAFPNVARIRNFTAGPKVLGASDSFRKVILGNMNQSCS